MVGGSRGMFKTKAQTRGAKVLRARERAERRLKRRKGGEASG